MSDSKTAVAVAKPAAVANLDNFPEAEFNRLSPIQTSVTPTDLMAPVIVVVQLEPADRDGKSPDHYSSRDVPPGHRAPTARGLNKLATAAGVSFYDERRLDDGRDPNVIGVTVMAELLLPTGLKIRAPGSQLIDLRTWFSGTTSEAEKAKFRKQFYAHVSTRARNRAIRGILSLRSSYRDADIAKPFAVVSFTLNPNHPAVQERMLDALAPTANALYGQAPAPQLAMGEQVTTLPEVDEDDPADEPPKRDVTPAAAGADEEPEWMRQAAPVATAPAAADDDSLIAKLKTNAEASERDGAMTPEQIRKLGALLGPVRERLGSVIRAAWGNDATSNLTEGQAAAILAVAATYATAEAFHAAWVRTSDELRAAA